MSPFAFGFHAVAVPSRSMAATRFRGVDAMLVNDPPTYTTRSVAAIARIGPLAPGFQSETLLSARMRAMFNLESPPTALKDPPMYQPPAPSGVATLTVPRTFGNPGRAAPLTGSSGTPPPQGGPMRVKLPPM